MAAMVSLIAGRAATLAPLLAPAGTGLIFFAGFVDQNLFKQSFANRTAANGLIILQHHVNHPPLGRIQGGNGLGLAIRLDLLGKFQSPLFQLFGTTLTVITYIKREHHSVRKTPGHHLAQQVLQTVQSSAIITDKDFLMLTTDSAGHAIVDNLNRDL